MWLVYSDHIDVLVRDLKARPASNFIVMVVNIPHFQPKDICTEDVTSGVYKLEVLGGNHTRLALQSLEEDHASLYTSWPVRLYAGLNSQQALKVGYDHNCCHDVAEKTLRI